MRIRTRCFSPPSITPKITNYRQIFSPIKDDSETAGDKQPQREFKFPIRNPKDIDKISNTKMNIMLPLQQPPKQAHPVDKKDKPITFTLAQPQVLPSNIQTKTPMKHATVKVNSVTASVVKHQKMV